MRRMKRTANILYWFLFLILTLLAVFSLYSGKRKWATAQSAEKTADFPRFRPENVHSFTVSWRDMVSTLAFENGAWVVRERGSARAQTARVVEFLNTLSTVRPLKELEHCDAKTIESLHLLEKTEKSSSIPGLKISLRDPRGKEIFSLILGKGHYTQRPSGLPGYETSSADGRYILLHREGKKDQVFLISRLFEDCYPNPAVWIEPLRLNEIQQLLTLSVGGVSPGGAADPEWILHRESLSEQFRFLRPEDARLDLGELSAALDLLSKPFSIDLLMNEPENFHPTVSLEAVLANGFRYSLRFQEYDESSSSSASGTAAEAAGAIARMQIQFSREAVQRLPNETDEQYALRSTLLESRSKYEMEALSGKFFLVPKDLPGLVQRLPASNAVRTK